MAIILPGGFNILNNEPVDARLTLADESTRYALSSANVYEGLIVFQQDNDTVWVLTDTGNVGNSNGWTQLQIGSVSSNLPSGVISGSDQVTASLDSRYVNETDFTTFSSSVDDRLDQIELVSSSQDGRLNNLELFSSSQESKDLTLETYTGSINSQISNIHSFTSSQESKDLTLETYTSSVDGHISDINSYTASNDTTNSTQNSRLSQIESVTSSLASTYEEKASGTHTLVSGSDQLTGSLVDLSSDQTINGTKTFNDIVVNGTGSFAYITSVSGNAKIIGDSFIVVNTDTPTSRYAGLSVYDSGSTLSTASFYFDGETNDWGYEYSSSTGVDYAVTIFGPEYTTKGSPTYLTTNKIPKAVDNHHLNDSNISDDGTTITLGSNSVVNGTFYATGTPLVSGSSQISYPDLSNIPAGIVSGSGQVTPLLPSGVVSGSTQITKSLQDVTSVGSTTSDSISITNSTTSTSKTTGALVVTGGIGTSDSIFAGGDIVAYASSDRRLKDNIQLISNPLQKINQIGGYSFNWNEENQNIYKGKDYGVIAQEIEEILPELVDTRENGYKAVKYDKLVSLLIEGIKDLSKQVEELKEKINKG